MTSEEFDAKDFDLNLNAMNMLLLYEKGKPEMLSEKAKIVLKVIHEMIESGELELSEEKGLLITKKGEDRLRE